MSGDQPCGVDELTGRRMRKLAEENRQLRQYVSEVMDRLRTNERLFSRLFALESQVLRATDAEDLCFTLLRGLRSQFDLDFVRFWFDRSSFMGQRSFRELSERDLVWIEEGEITDMGLNQQRVFLLQLDGQSFDWLLPSDAHLGSLALLTLGDLERPFGVLGLGSLDRERFSPDQSADFLAHLAQVLGLSLENAVAQERLARLSVRDQVTGAHNRRFLRPHSHHPVSHWFGGERDTCCLYLDVDHFRAWQREHGQEAADALLSDLCAHVRRQVRQQDLLIRMDGDEFVLLLPDCPRAKAEEIGGRIVQAIADAGLGVTVSIGAACCRPGQDMAVKALVDLADEAMYVAKALGGSRLEWSEDPAA